MPFMKTIDAVLQKIDNHAKAILSKGGGDKKLLLSISEVIGDIKQVIDASTYQELDGYCEKYHGFQRYALILQDLGERICNGGRLQKYNTKH